MINENITEVENKIVLENQKKSKHFWVYFWATIVFLAIVTIFLNITASKKLGDLSKVDREAKLEVILNDFKEKFPQFIRMTQELNNQSINEIKLSIDKNIDNAYYPLYSQIDNFSDFHYSLKGEYIEIGTVVFGDIQNILNDKLFNPAKFEEKLNTALVNINDDSLNIIKDQFNNMKEIIKGEMNLNDDEINFLFTEILNFSRTNMLNRFTSYTNNFFKGMGLGVGAGSAAILSKIISKKFAKVISKKIVTKVAIKAGTKFAGATAGATAGILSGLLCGPGSLICSPPAAFIGAVVGWVTTDGIMIEIDQKFNEKEFKDDIKTLINLEKENTKKTMYKIYADSIEKLSTDTNKSLFDIKNKQIIDIINE